MYILGFQEVGVGVCCCFIMLSLILHSLCDIVMSFAVLGGTMSQVQGSYEYYHYLQEGLNDTVMEYLLLSTYNILLSEVNIK